MVENEDANEFVTNLYRGLLRREPDPSGLSYHSNALQSGMTTHESLLRQFLDSEEYRSLTGTRLFVPPGHFYSPIVNKKEAEEYLKRTDLSKTSGNIPNIEIDQAAIRILWRELLPFMSNCDFNHDGDKRFRYRYNNPAFTFGDGIILHSMLRRFRPNNIIEIGSGWSSVCMLDTFDNFFSTDCNITFIEPYPALLRQLAGPLGPNVTIVEQPVQSVSLETFETLKSGDILFIDSTHVLRTGSDVCYELFDVLPRLNEGVIVHFHDITWPFEYPKDWIIDDNRSWNEIYALRAFLMDNSNWRIIMFNDYISKVERGLVGETFPRFLLDPGSSFWMKRL